MTRPAKKLPPLPNGPHGPVRVWRCSGYEARYGAYGDKPPRGWWALVAVSALLRENRAACPRCQRGLR